MFPSADPFAYPNQPVMEFGNIKQEHIGDMTGGGSRQAPQMFLSNGTNATMYDDMEGQLFGPIPPYLMQGQQVFDATAQMEAGGNIMSGFNQPDMLYHTGLTPNADINFDNIFSGDGDDWSNVTDQRFQI